MKHRTQFITHSFLHLISNIVYSPGCVPYHLLFLLNQIVLSFFFFSQSSYHWSAPWFCSWFSSLFNYTNFLCNILKHYPNSSDSQICIYSSNSLTLDPYTTSLLNISTWKSNKHQHSYPNNIHIQTELLFSPLKHIPYIICPSELMTTHNVIAQLVCWKKNIII